jgi:hypothetical protein
VFSALAIYFILFKSPKSIGKYKWYLLNITVRHFPVISKNIISIQIWSFVYDFYMTTVEMPMTLLPSPTMCSRGLLRNGGWIYGGLIGYVCSFNFTLKLCIQFEVVFPHSLWHLRNDRCLGIRLSMGRPFGYK